MNMWAHILDMIGNIYRDEFLPFFGNFFWHVIKITSCCSLATFKILLTYIYVYIYYNFSALTFLQSIFCSYSRVPATICYIIDQIMKRNLTSNDRNL